MAKSVLSSLVFIGRGTHAEERYISPSYLMHMRNVQEYRVGERRVDYSAISQMVSIPTLILSDAPRKRGALLLDAPFLSALQIRDFGPYGLKKILLGSIGTSFSAKYFVHTTSYSILQKSTSIVKL